MNDAHDNWCPHQYPQFKKDHPELLLRQAADESLVAEGMMEPHMHATAVDYGRAEIRRRQLEIIRDVCERYDIAGLELDFMRGPIYFRSTLEGKSATAEEVAILTAFLGEVRAVTETAGRRRGKPLLIAVRVAALKSQNLAIGLDVEKWLQDDLVDLVIPSLEWWPMTGPLGEMVELCRAHHVPAYAGLAGFEPDRLESWAGAATTAWEAGVDGIYTFNLFSPSLPHWHVLGAAETLAPCDKIYGVDNLNRKKIRSFENTLVFAGRLPLELEPGKTYSIILPVGEDLAQRHLCGMIEGPALALRLENSARTDLLEFRLNGELLKFEVICASEGVSCSARGMLLYKATPPAGGLKQGGNTLEIKLISQESDETGLVEISEALLYVPVSKKERKQMITRSQSAGQPLELEALRVDFLPEPEEKQRAGAKANCGFTLVEMLVTVAIIAVLVAVLFPSAGMMIEKGRAVACVGNLRQIGTALSLYASDNHGLAPTQVGTPEDYNDAWLRLNDTLWVSLGKLYEGGYVKSLKVFYCPDDKYNYEGKTYEGEALQSSYLYRSLYLADSLGSPGPLGRSGFLAGKVAAVDDITWIGARPKPRPMHPDGINVLYYGGDVVWWHDPNLKTTSYGRDDASTYIKTYLDRK